MPPIENRTCQINTYGSIFKFKPFFPIVFFCLIIGFSTCKTGKLNQNVAYRYSGKSALPTVKLKAHHIGNDSMRIYMGLNTSEISFDPQNMAYFSVMLRLYHNINGKTTQLADSVVFLRAATYNTLPTTTFDYTLYVPPQHEYLLHAYLVEDGTKKGYKGQMGLWRKKPYNQQDEQNYLLKNAQTDEVIYDNIVKKDNPVRIYYRNKTYAHFTVQYYPPAKGMALPPYSDNKENHLPTTPDSTFTTSAYLSPNREGIYYIQADTNTLAGITLLCVDNSFPKITTAADLIESLRYITRNEEYRDMLRAENPKASVDNFWLTRAGSPDRGRVLIKEYYSRVQRANEFFTTFQEGWKTDRGIIYIVYGQPEAVYLLPNAETWVYYPKGNQPKLQFDFIRQDLPFTNQHYHLIRDINYEPSWQNAVYEWRNGIITNTTQ